MATTNLSRFAQIFRSFGGRAETGEFSLEKTLQPVVEPYLYAWATVPPAAGQPFYFGSTYHCAGANPAGADHVVHYLRFNNTVGVPSTITAADYSWLSIWYWVRVFQAIDGVANISRPFDLFHGGGDPGPAATIRQAVGEQMSPGTTVVPVTDPLVSNGGLVALARNSQHRSDITRCRSGPPRTQS